MAFSELPDTDAQDLEPDLSLRSYSRQALRTDQKSDGGSLTFPLLGLFGEVGSLLSEVKKKQRDSASYLGYAQAVVEELGDVLWYLAVVADRGGLSLLEIAANLGRDLASWRKVVDAELSFASLQPELMPLNGAPTPAFEDTLLQLAGDVGLLLSEHQQGRLEANQAALSARLVVIFRGLVRAGTEAGVTLEAAAIKNLHKISDRWPTERLFPAPFDAGFPAGEQLPRRLVVDLTERELDGRMVVTAHYLDGAGLGDPLTDNISLADDYRFHDVFHLAHAAVLGWSPVLRALLRRKRKSDPFLDENQDGARARLIEEGLTSWVFTKARALKFFEGLGPGDLPFGLLKQLRDFVDGYEVEERPLWVWEETLLQGYAAFRFLQQNRLGRVTLDLDAHSLLVTPL